MVDDDDGPPPPAPAPVPLPVVPEPVADGEARALERARQFRDATRIQSVARGRSGRLKARKRLEGKLRIARRRQALAATTIQ